MAERRANRNYIRHLETIEELLENGAGGGGTPYAVKYTAQSLSSSEQSQARTNIGAAASSALSGKQDTLVSGTNIKTVGGQSLLGSGNVTINDTSAVKFDAAQSLTTAQKQQARQNIGAISADEMTNMEYVTAAIRPEAGANTMGKIYMIGPDANDEYERYFTQEVGGVYSWVPLGSTEIDLSGYATDDEVAQLEHKVDELYEKKTVVTGWVLNKYLTTNKGVGNAYDTVEHSTNGYRYVILQVSPGEKYIVNGTGGSSPRLWCFADANNIILTVSAASASGSNNNLIVTAPANATQLIINNLNGYTEDCYKLTYGDISTLKQSVYDVALPLLSKDVSTEVSTTFSSGCINYTGGVTASNYAVHSDFVAIQSGKVYSLLTKLSSAWYVAYYTSASESDFISSQVLGDNTDTLQTKVLTIPSTAVYMRVTKDNSANSKFFQTVAEILQEKVGNTLAWLESECVVKKYYIKRDGTGDYSNLVTALTALANDESNKEIYLEGGIHDIFSQMGGQTFLDNIPSDVSSSEWPTYSLMVPNNTKIIGIGEAILKFEVPDGTSSAKMAVICPLACRKNIVVENVTIIAQNCRYCIHDETGGTFDTYTKVFRNVKLYKTGGGYSQAYGAGFSFNNNLLFDGCLFSSDNSPVWSVHDNVAYSDYANIVIKNCIFVTSSSSITALRFGTQNALSGKKSVMIENCYLGSGKILLDDGNSFPNAYALTVAKSGTPTVTNNASTNPNEPIVYE